MLTPGGATVAAPHVAPPVLALASGGDQGVVIMASSMVGWGCLTVKGRCAARRWYRHYRDGFDRDTAKALVEAQVWGAYGASHFGWVTVLPS